MNQHQLGNLLIYAGLAAGLGYAYHDIVPSAEVRSHAAFAGALNGPLQPAAGEMRRAVVQQWASGEGCMHRRGAQVLEEAFRKKQTVPEAARQLRGELGRDLAWRYGAELLKRAPLAAAARAHGLDTARFTHAVAEGELQRAEALGVPFASEPQAAQAYHDIATLGFEGFRAKLAAQCALPS